MHWPRKVQEKFRRIPVSLKMKQNLALKNKMAAAAPRKPSK
jgi:hypothetical protein